MTRTPYALLVTGPTASGKSEFSVHLAKQIVEQSVAKAGEIVAADSVQLYRGHRIGGAIPDESERDGVPHHLFEMLPADAEFDVKRYTGAALRTAEDIALRGSLPIFVGGSTMYIEALLEGLAPLPEADERLREELESRSSADLYQELVECDPERAAGLHLNDRMRVLRALEVLRLTGSTYTEILKRAAREGALPLHVLVLVLLWPRDLLYERIKKRTDAMLQVGLQQETERLFKEFGANWQSQGALGYQQSLAALLQGRSDNLEQLKHEISQGTRRYAKRQMTYFRNSFVKFGYHILPDQVSSDQVSSPPNIFELGYEAGRQAESLPKRGERRRGFFVRDLRFDQLVEDVRLWTEKFKGQYSKSLPSEVSFHSDMKLYREVWYLSAERLLSDFRVGSNETTQECFGRPR